jgi:hypothetical protein
MSTKFSLIISVMFLSLGVYSQASAADPGGVAGSSIWLKADDGATNTGNNTTVTSWLDTAGVNIFTTNNSPLFQTNPGSNFNPSVRFNGTNTSFTGNTNITMNDVYSVAKFTNPAAGNQGTVLGGNTFNGLGATYYFGMVTGTNDVYVATPNIGTNNYNPIPALNTYTIMNARATGNKNYQFNGKTGATIGGNVRTTTPVVGKRTAASGPVYDQFLNGDVNEIINYTTVLSDVDRQKVDSYLATKYGITLDQTAPLSYLASDSTTYWDASVNATYNKNITVVGRDDASALNQKQSKSINTAGLVTVGRGSITATNAANTNTFAVDKSYFAFGDDNASLTWTTAGAPAARQILGRRFKAQSANFSETVKITAPDDSSALASKLPAELGGKVYLMVDNDGDGNFLTGTQQEVLMTLVGTEWESVSTVPSGAVFAFGTPAPLTLTVEQSASQVDPAKILTVGTLVKFTATFNQDVQSFLASDWTIGGTATGCSILSSTLVTPASVFEFTLDCGSSVANDTMTVTLSLDAGNATSLHGVTNAASTSIDNTVTLFKDVTPPAVPVCTAVPTPSNGTIAVVITCMGVEPGGTLTIPGTTCVPSPATATGVVVCTENVPGTVPSNPTASVKDTSGNTTPVVVAYVLDKSPPAAPGCTATPTVSDGTKKSVITCTGVELGATLTIPGMTCAPTPATATATVVCTEDIAGTVPSSPSITVKDALGNSLVLGASYTLTKPTLVDTGSNVLPSYLISALLFSTLGVIAKLKPKSQEDTNN